MSTEVVRQSTPHNCVLLVHSWSGSENGAVYRAKRSLDGGEPSLLG
jgi:hypothetical protein